MAKNPNNPRIFRGIEVAKDKLPCRHCKKEKNKEDFRVRTDSKTKKDFYNSSCKVCDNEIAKAYYDKKKFDYEFKKKNRQRVKEYQEKNFEEIRLRKDNPEYKKKKNEWELGRYYRKREEINAKQREKRKTPEFKAYMKAYRERRKEIIYQQEVITKKRYHEKNKTRLTDRYIVNLLRTQGYGTPEELFKNKELISTKKTKVLIARIKKLIKNLKNE